MQNHLKEIGMKVIILGAGQVGFAVAKYLAQDDHAVTIVDNNAERLAKISEKIDVQPILGFASYPEILEEAGAHEADLLIAVTASDEVNMVACEIAHGLFETKVKIARLRQSSYLKYRQSNLYNPQNLSIDVIISPEIEVAKAIHRNTQMSGVIDRLLLDHVDLQIVSIRCHAGAPMAHTPFNFLNSMLNDHQTSPFLIKRKETIIFPKNHEMILPGDDVLFLLHSTKIPLVIESMGHQQIQKRNIILVGGGNIGARLAQEIEGDTNFGRIKIIERDQKCCETLSMLLSNTLILNGDALDEDVLQQADISACDLLVAVTNDDKTNILMGCIAKHFGVKSVTCLLNNHTYATMVSSLNIDSLISPKDMTIASILKYVQCHQVDTIHAIVDGQAFVIETQAKQNSPIIGLNVEDLNIEHQVKILAISRDGQVFTNPCKMSIGLYDRLIILSSKKNLRKIEKLLIFNAVKS